MKTAFLRLMPFALILGTAFASPTPVLAQNTAGFTATLAKALDAPRNDIVESTMWRCSGANCIGADEGQRPSYICRQVVRKFGPVSRFASSKGDLTTADLAKCNAVK